MPTRFFVDENDLALGKALAAAHDDILFPGHAGLSEVPRGSLDDEWLAVIGERGLVVITRDKRIRYRPVERQRWIEHRVRGFVLTGRSSQSTSDSLEVLTRHWARMHALVEEHAPGPWMYSVTRERLRAIDL